MAMYFYCHHFQKKILGIPTSCMAVDLTNIDTNWLFT